MTHKDIYTKFMIEYDKAGASTSYPSLTEYEVATVLDKAYNALIAQKVTGNNVRRATFESDIKSIADLGPLVNTVILNGEADTSIAPNIYKFALDKYNAVYPITDYLFNGIIPDGIIPVDSGMADSNVLAQTVLWYQGITKFVIQSAFDNTKYYTESDDQDKHEQLTFLNALVEDKKQFCVYMGSLESGHLYLFDGHNLKEVSGNTHAEPTKLLYFLQGSMLYNSPTSIGGKRYTTFVEDAEADIEYNPIDLVTTGRGVPVKLVNHEMAQKFFTSVSNIPWIKLPVCFIEGKYIYVVYDLLNPPEKDFRVTYIKQPNTFVKDLDKYGGTVSYFDDQDQNLSDYEFECNSTVAEELVSLAVAFALENVESQRLNSKLNMRGLEA